MHIYLPEAVHIKSTSRGVFCIFHPGGKFPVYHILLYITWAVTEWVIQPLLTRAAICYVDLPERKKEGVEFATSIPLYITWAFTEWVIQTLLTRAAIWYMDLPERKRKG